MIKQHITTRVEIYQYKHNNIYNKPLYRASHVHILFITVIENTNSILYY